MFPSKIVAFRFLLAFLNPFTPERQARYRELLGENQDMDGGPFPELRKTLEELIENLGGEGALDYRTYGAQDGEWIESSPSLQDIIGFIRNWMHTSNENRIKQVPVLFLMEMAV